MQEYRAAADMGGEMHTGSRVSYVIKYMSINKKLNSSIRGLFLLHIKMSELMLRHKGDACVRATITSDGDYVFSVYDFLDLVCPNSKSYASVTWSRLISEDSEFKHELKFTMVYLKLQNEGLNNTTKRRFRKTPVMTLQGLVFGWQRWPPSSARSSWASSRGT